MDERPFPFLSRNRKFTSTDEGSYMTLMMLKWQVRLCHKFIVATTPHTIFPPSPQSNVDKTLWTDIHVWMYFSTLQQWKEERGFRYILTSCWNQNSKQLRVSTICDKACSFDKIKRLKLVNSVFQPLIITNISQLSYKLNKLLPAIWSGLNDSSTTLSPCHFLTRLTVQFFIQWQVEEALRDQKQERESRKGIGRQTGDPDLCVWLLT